MALRAPHPPAAAPEPPSQEVTVAIGDGKDEVSAGQIVRYEVVVRNGGAVETPLTVKLTLPAHAVTTLEAADAAVIANAVAWKNVVGAGETRTYSLAGRVNSATRSRSLTVTACVHERINAPAVACATDRNELTPESAPAANDDPGARRMAWIGAILFGILAVIGAVWLYRKVRPKPLTPTTVDQARLPGGTPSE
jgi:hypothetical protein